MENKICYCSLIGLAATGKTSLINQFLHGQFTPEYRMTIGVNPVIIPPQELKASPLTDAPRIYLWDISGQSQFRNLYDNVVSHTHLIVIVNRYGDRNTFGQFALLVEDKATRFPQIPKILVHTGMDLIEPTLPRTDSRMMALVIKHGMFFHETSAKTGEGLDRFFQKMAYILMGRWKEAPLAHEHALSDELCHRYVDDPNAFSTAHEDYLAKFISSNGRTFLSNHLPLSDPIFQKIDDFASFELGSGWDLIL